MDEHHKRALGIVRDMLEYDPNAADYITPEKVERIAAILRTRPAREPGVHGEWSQSARIQSLPSFGKRVQSPHGA